MALQLIDKSDFVGLINIDFKESDDLFDIVSAQVEEKMLIKLFGGAMYADMLNNPSTPDYQTLITIYLRRLVKFMFYYYFLLDRESYNTTVGEFEAMAENAAKNVGLRNKKLTDNYNTGYAVYYEAAIYIAENPTKYPLAAPYKVIKPLNVFGIPTPDYSYPQVYPCDHSDWFIRGKKCY